MNTPSPQITTSLTGMKIVTTHMLSSSVTVFIAFRAGSCFEDKQNSGIAHFLEHMFFKGGGKYPTPKSVAEAIDSVGGECNAFTSREYVCYYIKIAHEYISLAFDVLSEMIGEAAFLEEEIEKERKVIIEEIHMYEDNPSSKVEQMFDELLYGDTVYGWDIAGTIDSVHGITRDALLDYRDRWYRADNMVLSVAGAIDHNKIVDLAQVYFENKISHASTQIILPQVKYYDSASCFEYRDLQQAHINLGVPACSLLDEKKYIVHMLTTILGGNMSSRMFQSLREERGLCYYVYTEHQAYLHTGAFVCSAGVDVTRIDEALNAIQQECNTIASVGITEKELEQAKNYIFGQTALYLETSRSFAQYFAKRVLFYNDTLDWISLKPHYESITVDQVQECAQELFSDQLWRVACLSSRK